MIKIKKKIYYKLCSIKIFKLTVFFLAGFILFSCTGKQLIRFRSDSKIGFKTEKGKIVIPPKYQAAYPFSDKGIAVVRLNDKWLFIDQKGIAVDTSGYDYLGGFMNGVTVAYVGKGDYVKIALHYKYTGAYSLPENLYGKWAYVNANGKVIVAAGKYDFHFTYNNGDAWVISEKKYGLIDRLGNEIIPCKYERVGTQGQNGLCRVMLNGKWGVVNTKGKEIIPIEFDELKFDYTDTTLEAIEAKKGTKWGCFNKQGKAITSFKYDGIGSFMNGFASVTVGPKVEVNGDVTKIIEPGKTGFINRQGLEIVPL